MVAYRFGKGNPCLCCNREFKSDGRSNVRCRTASFGDDLILCRYADESHTVEGRHRAGMSSDGMHKWFVDREPGQRRSAPTCSRVPRPAPVAKIPPRPVRYEDTQYAQVHARSERFQPSEIPLLAFVFRMPTSFFESIEADLEHTSTIGHQQGNWLVIDEKGYRADDSCGAVAAHTRAMHGVREGEQQKKSPGHPNAIPGFARGFYQLSSWDRNPNGPILLVEGLSATFAVLAMGISCIGRANNRLGAAHLARWLKESGYSGREFITIADIDRKDGNGPKEGPGWTGGMQFSEEFGHVIGKPIALAFPPGSELPASPKDSRDWFIEQWDTRDEEYQRLAVPYMEGVRASAVVVEPKEPAAKVERHIGDDEFAHIRSLSPDQVTNILARSFEKHRESRAAKKLAQEQELRARLIAERPARRQAERDAEAAEAVRQAEAEVGRRARRAKVQADAEESRLLARAQAEARRLHELELDARHPERVTAREEARTPERLIARSIAEARMDQETYRCCDTRSHLNRNKASFSPFEIVVRCEKRCECEGCRNFLNYRDSEQANWRLRQADELFEFTVPAADWRKTYKQLRRVGANYSRTRYQNSDSLYVVCSRPIKRSCPVSLDAAMTEIRGMLCDWRGETRPITFSRAWRLPRAGKSDSEIVAPLGRSIDLCQIDDMVAALGVETFVANYGAPTLNAGEPAPRIFRKYLFKLASGALWDKESSDRFCQQYASARNVEVERSSAWDGYESRREKSSTYDLSKL